jgi:hypothetical protein
MVDNASTETKHTTRRLPSLHIQDGSTAGNDRRATMRFPLAAGCAFALMLATASHAQALDGQAVTNTTAGSKAIAHATSFGLGARTRWGLRRAMLPCKRHSDPRCHTHSHRTAQGQSGAPVRTGILDTGILGSGSDLGVAGLGGKGPAATGVPAKPTTSGPVIH